MDAKEGADQNGLFAVMAVIHRVIVRILSALVVVAVGGLVFSVLWGVVTRFVFDNQASWTEELARMLLIWVTLIGSSLAFAGHSHLGVDILARSLDPAARRLLAVLSQLMVLFFAVVILGQGGWAIVKDTYASGQVLAAMGISRAWVYVVVPISGVTTAYFTLETLLKLVCGHAENELEEEEV